MSGVMRTKYGLNDEDFTKLAERLEWIGEGGDKIVENYLHENGGEIIARHIQPLIPISKKGKNHARFDPKFYEQEDITMGVVVKISREGKAGGKYGKKFSRYYLSFVENGTGTSKAGRHAGFMGEGFQNSYDEVARGMIEEVEYFFGKQFL